MGLPKEKKKSCCLKLLKTVSGLKPQSVEIVWWKATFGWMRFSTSYCKSFREPCRSNYWVSCLIPKALRIRGKQQKCKTMYLKTIWITLDIKKKLSVIKEITLTIKYKECPYILSQKNTSILHPKKIAQKRRKEKKLIIK